MGGGGDENSSFFHSTIRRKEGKNSIKGLMVEGEWCEDPEKIKNGVFNYFKNVFNEENYKRPSFQNSNFKTLEDSDSEWLERQVSEIEVWEAIKDCGNQKAQGPDGFNFGFIKLIWNILKDDLMKAVRYFGSLVQYLMDVTHRL